MVQDLWCSLDRVSDKWYYGDPGILRERSLLSWGAILYKPLLIPPFQEQSQHIYHGPNQCVHFSSWQSSQVWIVVSQAHHHAIVVPYVGQPLFKLQICTQNNIGQECMLDVFRIYMRVFDDILSHLKQHFLRHIPFLKHDTLRKGQECGPVVVESGQKIIHSNKGKNRWHFYYIVRA